jgi:hypothetical protein
LRSRELSLDASPDVGPHDLHDAKSTLVKQLRSALATATLMVEVAPAHEADFSADLKDRILGLLGDLEENWGATSSS